MSLMPSAVGGRSDKGSVTSLAVLIMLVPFACARLPYTSEVIHEDPGTTVSLERNVDPAGYSHPVELASDQVATILEGFTLEDKQEYRGLQREPPSQRLFHEGDISRLAPLVAKALQKASPEERVRFVLRRPGLNPQYYDEETAGWLAIRDPYLYLTVEYFRTQMPTTTRDPYFTSDRFPTPPPVPKDYVLSFKAGRFWVQDAKGRPGLEYREFLRSQPPAAGSR